GGAVQFWDTRTGQKMLTLAGPTGVIRGVAFSRDGHSLVSLHDNDRIGVREAHRRQRPQVEQEEGRRWHSARAAEAEQATYGRSAAFHLERLHRTDLFVRPRLLAALKKAGDSPLTQAIRRNVSNTEAARAAASVGRSALGSPLSMLPLPAK